MRILCAIESHRGIEVVRPLHRQHQRRGELDAAEDEAATQTLKEAAAEAGRLGCAAAERLERGRPEQVIVSIAGELTARLVVLHARKSPHAYPRVGPPSVGHTARFVVDHSPTNVLLLRGGSAGAGIFG